MFLANFKFVAYLIDSNGFFFSFFVSYFHFRVYFAFFGSFRFFLLNFYVHFSNASAVSTSQNDHTIFSIVLKLLRPVSILFCLLPEI